METNGRFLRAISPGVAGKEGETGGRQGVGHWQRYYPPVPPVPPAAGKWQDDGRVERGIDLMKGNGELPLNWAVTKLGILFQLEYGKGLTKKDRVESGAYPVYGSNGIVGYHDKYLVEGPVLIVGRKGAAGAISYSSGSCWPIDTTYFVRDSEYIDIKFSYYLLKSLNLAKHEKSTAIPGLNRNDAYDETVFLPPLNEQTRIVAKIEALFAELDAGVASLKKAQAQLKTYRQALLKHAFSGKLTEQWRAENNGRLEDGPTLLQRIRAERQARYVAEVAAWEENGRQGRKPRPPKDLPPLTPAELEELPQLPAGWAWVKVGEMADLITKGASPNWQGFEYVSDPNQILFITSENIRDNYLDISQPKYLQQAFSEKQQSSVLKKGDVLLNIVGASIGRAALYNLNANANINQAVSLIRISDTAINKALFSLFLNSTFATSYYNSQKVDVARANLSLLDVSNIPFPYSSIREQQAITSELELRLSVTVQLEQTITTALQQAEALRQAILKKAFSGQLVPQDPADEATAVLLARIRAAKQIK